MAHVGCWAHVRRKFLEVVKARPKGSNKKGYADIGTNMDRTVIYDRA